jgi:hypothetical protein
MGTRDQGPHQGADEMKSLKSLLVGLVLLALNPFARAQAVPLKNAPAANEVVVVVNVKFEPRPDYSFYSAYNEYDPNEAEPFAPYVKLVTESKDSEDKGAIGKNASFKIKMTKDRTVMLLGFCAFLANYHDIQVLLPIQASIVVPQGTNFVYLGSLTYSCSGDYFDIASIAQGYDLDSARVFVKDQYGDAAAGALIRVPLKPRYSADEDEDEE